LATNMFADLLDKPSSSNVRKNMFADLLPPESKQVSGQPEFYDNSPVDFSKYLTTSHAVSEPVAQPVQSSRPDYKSAWISGTLGSLLGKALTPLAENITGKKVDLSTLPQPKTFGEKAVSFAGSNLSELPMWLLGDALLAKPLAALAKTAPVAKGIGILPKAITSALGTGVRAGTTYGLPINAAETAINGDGASGFADRLKRVPVMALGGTALHGAGQLVGKGIGEAGNILAERKLTYPEIKSNPLQNVQNAYKTSATLRDVKAQELNKTFSDPTNNLGKTGQTLPRQGATPEDLFQQKQADAMSAFGGPLKSYKINNDISEIEAMMDKRVKDIAASLKQADGQTRIETIRNRVKDMGGISPGNANIFEEQKVIPNWIRNRNGRSLDEVADTLGMSSDELLKAVDSSAYKPKDYELEAYRVAHNNPEYQNLSNTLDTLKTSMSTVKKVNGPISLKPREVKGEPVQDVPTMRPEKPAPLRWTNKDEIPKADLPYGRLGDKVGVDNSGINSMGKGFGSEIIEPKLAMRLQAFNDSLPDLPDTSSHIVSKTDKPPMTLDTLRKLRTKAYIKTTDNLHRLDQLDKYVEVTTGKKLSPEDKTYMLALNSRGTGTTASYILEEGLVGPKGDNVGESLKSITSQLKDKQVLKEFDNYLVNKHAITRMRLGEKVFPDEMKMTPGMSGAIVKRIESVHPEFKDLSNKIYEFQNKLSKAWLVDTGIVSPEAYGKWIMDNPHYVPNNRLFSELEQPGFSGSTKRGFASQSNPVKARSTSQRKVISPMESIMEHVDQYVKVAKRNEVMQTLIRNLEKNPDEFKGWAEIIPSDGQLKEGLMGDINKILETDGINGVAEAFNKQFDNIFQAKKQRLDLGNIVTGLVNGEKVHVRVSDPLLLDALTNLKPQGQQFVISALGQVTRVMKNLTTGINPVFSLARNIWRDIPTAFINSKSTNNPFVFGKDLLGSIVDIAGNKEVYKSYKALGGGHASSSVSASRNTLAESKARLLPGYAIKHPFKSALGGLERLNNTVETAPRLGEYKRFSKPGDYSSKVKGLYEANDVTTNFSRYGNVIKEADSIFPYLNAAWQGISKLSRAFKDNPVQAPVKALMAVTLPTIVLYQLNHSNPAYQQLSDYIKDNNFLFPKNDGTFVKIPKPREIGVVFGSSVERALRQWQDNDPEPFNRFMETIKTNFTPPTRSILAPLSDIRSNKNFVDAPIVSGEVSKLSPPYQFDEKTSEPAKFIGKKLNQSPQQIDYLARSYLGGVAQLGIPATTKNSSVLGTLGKQIMADPTFSNDIIGDFYNTKDKIDTSSSDAKATGDKSLEVGKKYKPIFAKASTQLSDIRKQIDKVQASQASNAEKEAKIRAFQIKMLNIAKAANSKFKLK